MKQSDVDLQLSLGGGKSGCEAIVSWITEKRQG